MILAGLKLNWMPTLLMAGSGQTFDVFRELPIPIIVSIVLVSKQLVGPCTYGQMK